MSDEARIANISLDAFEAIAEALKIAHRYGGIDGAHHKTWVIDQMVRALTGPDYPKWVANQKAGADGPDTYDWDEGIAP
jgi:hypothetical protein